MKKMITFIFVLAVLSLTTILAEETTPTVYTSNDWQYILLENGTAEIYLYAGDQTEVTIPDELDGYIVTSIGEESFRLCSSPLHIIISDNVTTINDRAFNGCLASTIAIPDSVTYIGDRAFYGCPELQSITIPASVTYIGEEAFSEHYMFFKLYVTRGSYAEQYCEDNSQWYKYAHTMQCGYLTYVLLPDGTAEITGHRTPEWAHWDGIDLVIPEQVDGHIVTSIGKSAFAYCVFVNNVIIPDTVTTICDEAFAYALDRSTAIIIPDSVTSFGKDVFHIYHDPILINVGSNAIAAQYCKDNGYRYCTEMNGDWMYNILEDGTAEIAGYTAQWPYHHMVVEIPEQLDGHVVTSIGARVFEKKTGIFIIPSTVSSIGDRAFAHDRYHDDFTTLIIVPDSVTSFGKDVFYGRDTFADLIRIEGNSIAAQYCEENGYNYEYDPVQY